MSDRIKRYTIEHFEKWQEWACKIPAIEFPAGWKVTIIPPFCGAIARFYVQVPGQLENKSIYLDVFDALGCVGKPYWEVYPYKNDVGRCAMADVEKLLEMIADGEGNT